MNKAYQGVKHDARSDVIESKQLQLEKWIRSLGIFCGILVVFGFAAAIVGSFWFDFHSDRGLESFGNFAAGTVAAFWSLAGLVLIFIAFLGQKQELLLQKDELRSNREELKETREVMNQQKKEFELQNKTLSNQNFQNLFFQMLRNHSDIVHHIDLGQGTARVSGRDCFGQIFNDFRNEYGKLANESADEKSRIERAYNISYSKYRIDLSHYFRNLYNFAKVIDESEISEKDKNMFMNILKAQLSTYELALLFYNCLSSYGSKKFKPLVEKYQMVKNLPEIVLADSKHLELYDGINL